jgi:hypothetical protein
MPIIRDDGHRLVYLLSFNSARFFWGRVSYIIVIRVPGGRIGGEKHKSCWDNVRYSTPG